jgi:hypothetical protein
MRATHIQASGCIAACQTYGISCHPERLIPFGFVVAWTDSTGGDIAWMFDRLKFPVMMRAAVIQTESMGCVTAVLGQTMDAATRTCDHGGYASRCSPRIEDRS